MTMIGIAMTIQGFIGNIYMYFCPIKTFIRKLLAPAGASALAGALVLTFDSRRVEALSQSLGRLT